MEAAELFDPYIQIDILNQSKKTSVKHDQDRKCHIVYNEHLFFELENMSNQVISDAVIEFKVLNKGYFKREIIGNFKLGVQKIYNMADHVMKH